MLPTAAPPMAALKHVGIYDRVKDRLVMGENISQAAQFVESGNAQAGFVALAHAAHPRCRAKANIGKFPPNTIHR